MEGKKGIETPTVDCCKDICNTSISPTVASRKVELSLLDVGGFKSIISET